LYLCYCTIYQHTVESFFISLLFGNLEEGLMHGIIGRYYNMNKEVTFTSASSPGRVCLAGESLDWMIGGPSIVGAIGLRVMASVKDIKSDGKEDEVLIRALDPFNVERRIQLSRIGIYNRHTLDFMQASIKVLLDRGLPIHSFQIDSYTELPTEAGVSSSAAISLATIAAVGQHFGIERTQMQICGLAYQAEKNELKTGVGQMDFYACGLGNLHYLNCATEPPNPLEKYPIPKGVKLLLVDTLTSHSTTKSIPRKRERFAAGDPLIMAYIDKALAAVEKIRSLMPEFERHVEEIGHNVSLCHRYLRDDVRSSTDLLDRCVDTCLANGAYGGKLIGSGMGGCMFALAREEDLGKIQNALTSLPVKVYITAFSQDGVKIE